MDLLEEFRALAAAASHAEFSAVRIGGRRNDYLSKTAEGAPIFLISDSSAAAYTPGTTLKNLSVQFHATCRVHSPAGGAEGQFALVACDESVPELYELFVRCVSAAIEQLPEIAVTQDIEACVQSLLNLFRAMNAPGGREIGGLWAELFVITQAGDTRAAVRAWHADAFERFDFSWARGVLEVKATQSNLRAHEFSLEQLAAPSAGLGLVASFLLQPLTNGVGVMDLAAEIDAGLKSDSDLRTRLWSNMTSALGSDFSEKLDRRYDRSFAERQAAIFNMADVPAPDQPTDPRVTSIRFRSDLTTVTTSVTKSVIGVLRDVFSQER